MDSTELLRLLELELKNRDAQLALYRANLEEIIQDHGDFRDFVDGRARHIRRLIMKYGQRLQILELQQAAYGSIHVPPEILIEIQDIRTDLEELRCQIKLSGDKADELFGDWSD